MPRVPRFTIAAVDEFHRQLRFAPAATRIREMNAAERLVGDIDPDRNYPEDFVVFRITGYRPDRSEGSATFVGEALVGDLVVLIQSLSAGLELPPDYDGREALALDEVATRLKVSVKTLRRYRRRGLVCHYVLCEDGTPRLSRFRDALDRFRERHRERMDRARAFNRVTDARRKEIIDEARTLHESRGASLNEAALTLSRTHDRAHETIRGILRRHDRSAGRPIFREHGPLTDRDTRLIHRAWAWGVPVSTLAKRFGKTAASIRRACRRRRADLLRGLDIGWLDLPTFAREDAEEVILSAPPVNTALDAIPDLDDLLAMIDAAHARSTPSLDVEAALVAGFNLLKRRARRAIDALPPWPGAAGLDAIETDLRWAGRLKRRLVALGLPSAVERIEQNLHRPLASQPTDRIVALVRHALDVNDRAVETLDAARDQKLDRVVAYAMDRCLAGPARHLTDQASRAASRHEHRVSLPGGYGTLNAWDPLLSLRADLLAGVEALDPAATDALRLHYGLRAGPPLTVAAIADRLDSSPIAVTRLLRGAERALRQHARSRRAYPPAPVSTSDSSTIRSRNARGASGGDSASA